MAAERSVLSILQGMIGHEVSSIDEFEVEKGMIKRFAIAIGDPNPLYCDEEFAKKTPYGGIIAPLTFVFEWNHHKHGVIPPPPERDSIFAGLERQPRMLRAISEYSVMQPVRPGDIIESRARVTEVYEKQGRSGQLVFLISETDFFNQRGEKLANTRDTNVFIS
ncbi:MaoC family dehydratase N-terminal domain-containing protein [Chloroflexota bacterium]